MHEPTQWRAPHYVLRTVSGLKPLTHQLFLQFLFLRVIPFTVTIAATKGEKITIWLCSPEQSSLLCKARLLTWQ